MPPLRIVFMGTPDFAVPSLRALLDAGRDVVAVVTGPDKPRGRGQKVSFTPVKELAVAQNLPVLQPASLRDPAFADHLRSFRPDLMAVVAFRILPPSIFTMPPMGAFNLHGSLLPRYRGAAPIPWALINGETETGVTTFVLREQVDTGVILLQRRIPILPDDDAGTLHDRMAEIGAGLVAETVTMLASGHAKAVAQDDALATPAPRIFREDCRIDWTSPAQAIHNRIRGLSPHPAAFTLHRGKVIKLYRSAVAAPRPGAAPGTVVASGPGLTVATGEGSLSILEMQQEGKKRMGVEEFLRGYAVAAGELLGELGA